MSAEREDTPMGSSGAVLVTGAGGPAGVAVIRSLAAAGHRTAAVDIDPLAVGLHLADDSATVPRFDSAEYLDGLLFVADKFEVDTLISTVAEEMLVLCRHVDRLADAGVRTWLPTPVAVEDCVDKWRFARRLADADVRAPATGLAEAPTAEGPWIVKPRFGRGSRDVHLVATDPGLRAAIDATPEPIVQTVASGREFTADVLVDRHGDAAVVVPRWRSETRGGISTRGTTFVHAAVDHEVRAALAAVGMTGPANVQGFVDDAEQVSIVEINPRFSGGLPLTLAAGADVVGQYLSGIRGDDLDRDALRWRPGVTMLRHFEEVFLG